MSFTRTHFLPLLTVSAGLLAIAPGCSGNKDAVVQVGVVWTLTPATDSSVCPVAGSDQYTIGGGSLNGDSTVASGSSSNGVPITASCTVSGSDAAGYSLFLTSTYGSDLASMTIKSSHIGGTHNATTSESVTATFSDNLPKGFLSTLSQSNCTLTYPSTLLNAGAGIAPGRIWAHIDCPAATDGTHTCDASADFRFENCGQ